MRRLSVVRRLAGAGLIFLTQLSPANALTAEKSDIMSALSGAKNVNLILQVDNKSTCRVSENLIRASLVNKLVPAGLVINSAAPYWIILYALLLPAADGRCVAATQLYSGVVGTVITFPHSMETEPQSFSSFVSMHRTGTLATFVRADEDFFLRALIQNVDEHLALWREANAGSDFVRAPASAPTPPNLRLIQQRLQALGLYRGAVDGISGPGTQAAIQQFQRQNQLPATGEPDIDTMRRLFP